MAVKFPNFFIIGAPKCGTTSLASWLRRHESVYMSPIKEPNFFNTDVKTIGRMTRREYESLFDGVTSSHIAVGEATTNYLRSETAIEGILEYADDPRFIVCIRNPIEMVVSLHGEFVKHGLETETSFTRAWRLQDTRRQGRQVPRLCLHNEDLLYGPICRIGGQIERVRNLAGNDRVLVLVLDDMKTDPAGVYRNALEFLGVPDDGRAEFPTENQALYLSPYVAGPLRFGALIKRRLHIRTETGLIRVVRRLVGRPGLKADVTPELRNELRAYFSDDVARLRTVLGRDFSFWLNGREETRQQATHHGHSPSGDPFLASRGSRRGGI